MVKHFKVTIGEAVLTRPGSSDGLKPFGDSLTMIISYEQVKK